jgi:hypothetical protein
MNKAQQFYDDMLQSGWHINHMWDECQKQTRSFCTFDGVGCLIDTKANKVEFMEMERDWGIKYPLDKFSQSELDLYRTQCDCCGVVQLSIDDLKEWNCGGKACTSCFEVNCEQG